MCLSQLDKAQLLWPPSAPMEHSGNLKRAKDKGIVGHRLSPEENSSILQLPTSTQVLLILRDPSAPARRSHMHLTYGVSVSPQVNRQWLEQLSVLWALQPQCKPVCVSGHCSLILARILNTWRAAKSQISGPTPTVSNSVVPETAFLSSSRVLY